MSPVAGLALATAAFVSTHLLLSHPWRKPLARRMGERGFLAFYSLVALLALGAMVHFWRAAPPAYPLWIAPSLWWWVMSFLMLAASILLAGSLARNPAFPHPGADPDMPAPAPRGVFAITRHPMNWSFILWALAHLSLWGTPRNIIVSSGILVLAVAGSIGQDRKKLEREGARWRNWMERTSFLPFRAVLAGRLRWRDARPGWGAGLGGLAFWLAVTWWHAPTVSPIAVGMLLWGALA